MICLEIRRFPSKTGLKQLRKDGSAQECDTWARSGECDRNPEFMLRTCALSCGKLKRVKEPKSDREALKKKAEEELQNMEKFFEEKNRAALREVERQPLPQRVWSVC